jgi:TfoX/Sxy family transcriptional regulator of competence genes
MLLQAIDAGGQTLAGIAAERADVSAAYLKLFAASHLLVVDLHQSRLTFGRDLVLVSPQTGDALSPTFRDICARGLEIGAARRQRPLLGSVFSRALRESRRCQSEKESDSRCEFHEPSPIAVSSGSRTMKRRGGTDPSKPRQHCHLRHRNLGTSLQDQAALKKQGSTMASQQKTIDFLIEQVRGPITTRRMFGEFGIYWDGKIVAFVCDDELFVKPTKAGRTFAADAPEGQPYPNAKPHLLISGDAWEDGEWLSELLRVTAADLPTAVKKPTPKKKARKK